MSSIADNGKYVVYKWTERGRALFTLYDGDHDGDADRPRLLREIAMDPNDVPEGTEHLDHFWVILDEEGEVEALEFDPEFTKRKKEDYQDAAEMFDRMQERDREKLEEKNDE